MMVDFNPYLNDYQATRHLAQWQPALKDSWTECIFDFESHGSPALTRSIFRLNVKYAPPPGNANTAIEITMPIAAFSPVLRPADLATEDVGAEVGPAGRELEAEVEVDDTASP